MIDLDDNEFDKAAAQVADSVSRHEVSGQIKPMPGTAAPKMTIDQAAGQVVQGQRAQLRASLYDSLTANPDFAARATVVGRRTGLPSDLVERNMDDVVKRDQLNEYDKLLDNSPQLATFLGIPQNARMAHDDVGALSTTENFIGQITPPAADFFTVSKGLLNSLPLGARMAREGLRLQMADLYDNLGLFGKDANERMRQDALRNYSEASLQQDVNRPDIHSATLRGIYSGGESLLRQAPGLTLGALTRSTAPILATAGVQTESEAYAKYRARGATAGQALTGGVAEGAIEVATEKLPMGFLVDKFGKVGAGQFISGLLAREIPGEQLATLAQDAVDTAIANPEKTWEQYLKERPDAAYQTLVATITQSGIMGLASGVVNRAAQRQQQAMDAERNGQSLAGMAAGAAASKLRERDNVTFEQFVAQAAEDGPVQDLYISAQALQQSGVNLDDMLAASPSVRAQLGEALATGGDIRIPVEEFAGRLSGPEFAQALVPHLKTDPTGMSQAEAQEFFQNEGAALQEDVQRSVQQQISDNGFNAARDQVATTMLEQLNQVGRFTPDVNQAYANLVANFYSVQAARLGTTPTELAERYPLQVRAQRIVDGGQQLDQGEQDATGVSSDVAAPVAATPAGQPGAEPTARLQRPATIGSWSAENREAWSKPWETIKRLAGEGKVTPADAAQVKEIARAGQKGAGQKLADLVKEIRRRPAQELQQTEQPVAGELAQPELPPARTAKARGSILLGDDVTMTPSVITLLKNADLSTFLHESGHFFLEVMNHIATQEGAPDAVKQDMDAVLQWFGVPDLATWNAMEFEAKRNYHEQFARGFEAFLFEGKSPNLEMQGVFQRFRAWLLNVYKSLKNLNVELTDEVRGVFDRMLASTEQIKEAEAVRGYGDLFQNKPDFMTDQQWSEYQSLGRDATLSAISNLESRSLRDMRWLSNAKSRVLKNLQADAKEKRAAVRDEVAKEVNAEPINQARRFLRSGEMTDEVGQEVKIEKGFRLNTEALAEMYPESMLARPDVKGLRGMTSKEGLHPDMVAEMFGYSSGDQLIRQLLAEPAAKEKIDAETDARMLERYGDLTDAKSLSSAADLAVHDEARAKFVAAELNALNKAIGSKPVLARAAREYAEATIAQQRIRDLKPSQYAAAAARAARAADKAFKAGDVEQAAAEKRNQLVNTYVDRAAHQAQEEVSKIVDYLNKFNNEGTRKNLDIDYREQIDALLARFDLRKGQTLRDIDRRQSLADWVAKQREMGVEPNIPEELLNESNLKPFKNMTVEELRGLRDTVKQIEHLARLKHRLLTAKDKREYEAVRDEIAGSIIEHAGERQADTRTATTNLGRAQQWLRRRWAEHLKVNTLARVLDGGQDGGPVWEYFVRTANERGDQEATARAEATKALTDILAPVFKLGKMGGKGVFFPSINRSLNREARLSIALNTGNAGNLQRLLGGEGWTLAQIQPVLDSLTKQEWDAVQAIWDHFESYRPQIAAKERRVSGVEPDWVEPSQVQTKFGTYRGGYYPVKYDPRASQRAEEHADAEDARRQMQSAYTSATTRRSFTKSRADEVYGRPLMYTLAGLYSGVNDVIHDLAWHEWLIDTNRLLKSDKVDRAIREKYGPEIKDQFKSWVKDIAEGDQAAAGAGEAALSALRQNVSVAGLGFNAMSAAMQGLGITQSIVRVGPRWIAQGIASYIGSPRVTTRMVNEKSEFMRNRSRTQMRELNELRNKVQGSQTDWVKTHAYVFMMRAQQMVDMPTWIGAYEKAVVNGEDEARAVALADQAVIDAQGGGQTKDLSAIERGGPAMKLFTTFYSFMNTALNLGVAQTMTSKSKAKLASDYLLLYSAPPALGFLLKNALTPGDSGDDDDFGKLAKKLLAEQIGYLMGLMVVVREFGEAGKIVSGQQSFGYQGPAGVRVIGDTIKFTEQAMQGDFDDSFRKAAVNLVADFTGLPGSQINRTITGTKAIAEGKTENPAAVVFGFQEKK